MLDLFPKDVSGLGVVRGGGAYGLGTASRSVLTSCDPGVQGSGFRVQGAGCRLQGSGCNVQGAGFRVQGAGCRLEVPACQTQVIELFVLAVMYF